MIDEYSRQSLVIRVDHRLHSQDLIKTLPDARLVQGIPAQRIRSDNEPEFVALALRKWLSGLGARPYIESRAARGKTANVNLSTANLGLALHNFSLLLFERGLDESHPYERCYAATALATHDDWSGLESYRLGAPLATTMIERATVDDLSRGRESRALSILERC